MSLLDRALRVIPTGAQAFSKARSSWPAVAPSFIVGGKGAHVWDDEGNEYIDLTMAIGAVTLGYQDPDVEAAVADQCAEGPLFSLSHPIEVEVAERLTSGLIPRAKDGMARFFKTGSDATSAAVRVARAYTGRDVVMSNGYHGMDEWVCPNPVGIPSFMRLATEQFTDWDHAVGRASWPPPAAVIVEPDVFHVEQLRSMREWCDKNGVVLIFDEILNGFRLAPGGHQELCGVTPDLATYSKALGNGYAIAAVVGKRDVMMAFERVGVSGTFLGDTIGLAAAKAVIAKTGVASSDYYHRLWDIGSRLWAGVESEAFSAGIKVERVGNYPRFGLRFKDDVDVDPIIRDRAPTLPWRTLWAQELIQRGVLGNFGFSASFALSDLDVEQCLEANRAAFGVLASVDDPKERLIGAAAGPGVRVA